MERLKDWNTNPFVESIKLNLEPLHEWYEAEFINASWLEKVYEADTFLLFLKELIKNPKATKYKWKLRPKCKWTMYIYKEEKIVDQIKFNKLNKITKKVLELAKESKKNKSIINVNIYFEPNEQVLWNLVFGVPIISWEINQKKKKNNIGFIYDTNFKFKEWWKESKYGTLKDKFDCIQSGSFLFSEISNCLLEREKIWTFTKKEEEKLLASFKKEVSKINTTLSPFISVFFQFSYTIFMWIYNTLEDIKKQNPWKYFPQIKNQFFQILNTQINLDQSFFNKHHMFFLKIYDKIDTRNPNRRTESLVDWLNVFFTIVINVFSEVDAKAVFISDDGDIQTISKFFMEYLLPWYIANIIYQKIKIYFQNDNILYLEYLKSTSKVETTLEWNTLIIDSDLMQRIESIIKDYLNNPNFKYKIENEQKKQIACLFAPSKNTITNLYFPESMIDIIKWNNMNLSSVTVYIMNVLKLIYTLEWQTQVA